MSKKIKVKELLNMMATGKKMPTKIKYFDTVYEYNENISVDYFFSYNFGYDKDYLFSGHNTNILNDYVEILEDEEEIYIKQLNPNSTYFKDGTELVYKVMYDKINELVEKVNKIDKKINKED